MNITVNKIKEELQKEYGWENLDCEDKKWFVEGLIKDTLLIVAGLSITVDNFYCQEQQYNKTKQCLKQFITCFSKEL